jgi:ubiquinone biosynthesis protein Coq4
MSKRSGDFIDFSLTVARHIDHYTVPQYGDRPDDQVETWTPEQCMDSIKRYCNRFGSNRRGRIETLRDMVKIAHFAQLIYDKMQPDEEEKRMIEGGYR